MRVAVSRPHAGTSPSTVAGAATPLGPSFVLEAQGRLQRIVASQLPRLEELRSALAAQAADGAGTKLERVLPEHLAAVAALRFELLVAPGLRADPLPRDEATFREGVVAVTERTEATWGAIRDFVERGAGQAGEIAEDYADFILEVRSIQRTETELGPALREVAEQLRLRTANAASDVSRQALAELQRKVDGLLHRLAQLRAVCEAGHRVQRLAYELADENAVCRATLKSLAQRLGGGLLEHLHALVAPGRVAKSDALDQAQQARTELLRDLQEAVQRIAAMQERRGDLRKVLADLGEKCRAAGHSGSAGW